MYWDVENWKPVDKCFYMRGFESRARGMVGSSGVGGLVRRMSDEVSLVARLLQAAAEVAGPSWTPHPPPPHPPIPSPPISYMPEFKEGIGNVQLKTTIGFCSVYLMKHVTKTNSQIFTIHPNFRFPVYILPPWPNQFEIITYTQDGKDIIWDIWRDEWEGGDGEPSGRKKWNKYPDRSIGRETFRPFRKLWQTFQPTVR